MIRLSVLGQSTIVSGRSPDASIRESLELARHCEALVYERYWCAEHHNSDSQAGTAPEILIAAIAATTQRIRVGSAWIMLPHYSALKVAEQFRGHCRVNLGWAAWDEGGVVQCRSSCVLGARLVVPDCESVQPDRAIGIGCKSMSAGMEVTVDE
jgi:Luciferase-like monooxygenase